MIGDKVCLHGLSHHPAIRLGFQLIVNHDAAGEGNAVAAHERLANAEILECSVRKRTRELKGLRANHAASQN
ncbi:hypothetical protein D3C85_1495320 [compost metagenome]